jgi:hypothetical protein
MAESEIGLFKTKKSKFFLFTLVSSGLAYFGLKHLRESHPQTY